MSTAEILKARGEHKSKVVELYYAAAGLSKAPSINKLARLAFGDLLEWQLGPRQSKEKILKKTIFSFGQQKKCRIL